MAAAEQNGLISDAGHLPHHETTNFILGGKDAVALSGLDFLLMTQTQGFALGYHLAGIQPFETASTSISGSPFFVVLWLKDFMSYSS